MVEEGYEWSMCDPFQLWVELWESWNQEDFKGWLKSLVETGDDRGTKENWMLRAEDTEHLV